MESYERLKQIREERGYSVEDIAKVLEVSPQRVRNFESGLCPMQMHHYIRLARFYDLRIDYLAGLIDEAATLPKS